MFNRGMIVFNVRKYEISFLVFTSLLLTLMNNLPYYSLHFSSSTTFPKP